MGFSSQNAILLPLHVVSFGQRPSTRPTLERILSPLKMAPSATPSSVTPTSESKLPIPVSTKTFSSVRLSPTTASSSPYNLFSRTRLRRLKQLKRSSPPSKPPASSISQTSPPSSPPPSSHPSSNNQPDSSPALSTRRMAWPGPQPVQTEATCAWDGRKRARV